LHYIAEEMYCHFVVGNKRERASMSLKNNVCFCHIRMYCQMEFVITKLFQNLSFKKRIIWHCAFYFFQNLQRCDLHWMMKCLPYKKYIYIRLFSVNHYWSFLICLANIIKYIWSWGLAFSCRGKSKNIKVSSKISPRTLHLALTNSLLMASLNLPYMLNAILVGPASLCVSIFKVSLRELSA